MRRAGLLLLLIACCAAGLEAQFGVSPNALIFGNVNVGATATLPFLVTANPPANLHMFTVMVTSATGATISVDLPNFQLLSGQSIIVTVTLIVNAGGPFSGSIQVRDITLNSPPSMATIPVSGTGVAAPPPPGPGPGPAPEPLPAPVPEPGPPQVTVTATPGMLDFGGGLVGCPYSQDIDIKASTAVDLSFRSSNSTFSASAAAATGVTSGRVRVSSKTTAPGPVSGFITVIATLEGQVVQHSAIFVSALGVGLSAKPNAFDFPTVPVGGSASLSGQLFTTSPLERTLPVKLNSDNPAFDGSSSPLPSGFFDVTFTPTGGGPSSATIELQASDPRTPSCVSTTRLPVTGVGRKLDVSVTPGIDFGKVAQGTMPPSQKAVLRNNSDFGCAGTVTGKVGVKPASFKVAARGSQEFDVTLDASAAGPQTDTLRFALSCTAGDAPSARLVLTTTVTGRVTVCSLSVAPAEVDFGLLARGDLMTRRIRAANSGDGACDVRAAARDPFVSVSPNSFSLEPGASRDVELQLVAIRTGRLQSEVRFSTPNSTLVVSVTGTGVDPTVGVVAGNRPISSGGDLSLGTTSVGLSNFVPIQVTNTSAVPASINSIRVGPRTGATLAFQGTGETAFQLEGLPTLPASVPPGGTLSFTATFRPNDPGAATAAISVEGGSLSFAFNLTGTGLVAGAAITGASGTVAPVQQPRVGLGLSRSYGVPIRGTLRMGIALNAAGPEDPAVRFSNGFRTADFTIPAGSAVALFGNATDIGFQSGSVAAQINFDATLDVDGIDVTPPTTPRGSVTILRAAPVITSATIASRTGTGFQLVIVGFATSRAVNTLSGQFTVSPGVNVQVRGLPLDLSSTFTSWYNSAAAAPFGSLFTLTVPVNADGDLNNAKTGSFTLANADGTSPAVQVTISP